MKKPTRQKQLAVPRASYTRPIDVSLNVPAALPILRAIAADLTEDPMLRAQAAAAVAKLTLQLPD